MNTFSICAVALLAVAADGPDKKLVEEATTSLRKQHELLKTIKDKATAEAALKKLDTVAREFEKVEKAIKAMKPEKAMAIAKNKELNALGKDIQKEYTRIVKLPAAYAAVRKTTLFVKWREAMVNVARARTKDLATKVELYYVQNGNTYPPNMEALAEKQPGGLNALVTKDALIDPWGRPFQFTIATDDKGNDRVVITSLGHPGEKDAKITNLDKVAPPKK
jgi:hypothetical protein